MPFHALQGHTPRAHLCSFDMRCVSLQTAGVGSGVAARACASPSRTIRPASGRPHLALVPRKDSPRFDEKIRRSSGLPIPSAVAVPFPGTDDECIPSWVDDPGLNKALLCDPSYLSVSRRFTQSEEWDRYQSPARYWEMLTTIVGSGTAKRVAVPVVSISVFSVLVAYVKTNVSSGLIISNALSTLTPMVTVAGGAVTLLLAFRTNSAFARFNQAADTFAAVISATRNLSRKMVVWCPVEDRERNAKLVAAIPWAIKHRGQGLEGTSAARDELESVMGCDLCDELLATPGSVPGVLVTEITRGLDKMNEHRVELIYQLLMDNDLTALHNAIATVDRIASTPTPVSYARHITRGLLIWLTLFVASSGSVGTTMSAAALLISTPANAFLAWLTLGIDDIGMQLEQPFTILAVKQFCEECERDVVHEIVDSAWTPRVGAPRDDVLASDFLNSEMTAFERAARGIPRRQEDGNTNAIAEQLDTEQLDRTADGTWEVYKFQ